MSPASNEPYDVAVIGAGPAGATAAIRLAAKKRRVVLIDAAKFPRRQSVAGWLNSRVAPILAELGVPTKQLLDRPFKDVTFHSAELDKSAKPRFEQSPGFLIDRAAFANALVEKARANEAVLIQGKKAVAIRPLENTVQVELDGEQVVEGRLLLLASGRGSEFIHAVGLSRNLSESPVISTQIDVPLKGKQGSSEPRVGVVFGLEKRGSFGMYWVCDRVQTISMNWYGEAEQAPPRFVQLCRQISEAGVAPIDITADAAKARFARLPASAALDMDTHVGKHTLLIGDAGGFVCAASSEGIYPAMWSAMIAGDVVHEALDSVHSQDALMRFNTEWRMQMADYLRSPNTDSQFLIPLIFTNQPMADRMAAAFFSGENI